MNNSDKDYVKKLQFLKDQSNKSRLASLEITYNAGMGHLGPDYSCLDILTVLYFSVLQIDPDNPTWEQRDRFILSKGHAAGALYVTLAARGFFPEDWLKTYQKFDSNLYGHPDRNKVPGVEHNTGALGHGLSVATGLAAAVRQTFKGQAVPNVYTVVGDGELQEGSNWEAIMLASHLKLGNLTAIVDNNGLQQGDSLQNTVALPDLKAKWRCFGWDAIDVDGHDFAELLDALQRRDDSADLPRVVIAHTTKGKGVSFMENSPSWHHKIPSLPEYESATTELKEKLSRRDYRE